MCSPGGSGTCSVAQTDFKFKTHLPQLLSAGIIDMSGQSHYECVPSFFFKVKVGPCLNGKNSEMFSDLHVLMNLRRKIIWTLFLKLGISFFSFKASVSQYL